jgi:hypothetical protein
MDNNVLYSRTEKGNEPQSTLKEAVKLDRQDEQFPNLRKKTEIFPSLKTTKTVVKHIPVIVNTEAITNNCDNIP